MKAKKMILLATTLSAALVFSACQATDVVGRIAVTSFEQLLNTASDKVTFDDEKNSWSLESPAGDEFKWSKDFSATVVDGILEFDAAPFINAGLDVTKLPEGYVYDQGSDRLSLNFEIGQEKFDYNGDATALDTFKNIVEKKREIVGYHDALDHYGIALGNGNMFEWAKDMSNNDKDIVFVVNPQPFMDAGVEPEKVEGWAFAKVEVKDEAGKMVEVDKFLKPFDLK
jgi:hypothetical protein